MTKFQRDTAMTWITWIANTGGLMGLCMGLSFVSIAEIIYYICLTVATHCVVWKGKKEHTSSVLNVENGLSDSTKVPIDIFDL